MAKTPSGVLKVVAVDQYGIVVGRSSLVSILDTASRTPSNIAKVYLTDEYGNVSTLAIPTPENVLMNAQGLKSQNFDRQAASTQSALTDQRAYYMLIPLLAGTVITNIHTAVGSAGTLTDFAKVGLYSAAGVLLASTADLGSVWETTGTKTHALSATYTVPSTGGYYICILASTNGGTLPGFLRNAGGATMSPALNAIGSNDAPSYVQNTQTDLPSTATFTAAGSAQITFWVGVS